MNKMGYEVIMIVQFISSCNNIMFGDVFDTPEEILSGNKEGNVQSSWDRLPRNCAHFLELPQKQRKLGYPIGLKNQGATCYLNSLLQILYYTPEFRKIILKLPLCQGSLDKPSNFVSAGKQVFLVGFQRLFSEMSCCDVNSLKTDYLTKSFGWEGKEHFEQQDIQEALRITIDTVERALFGTEYEQEIKQLFKGMTTRYKQCQACTIIHDKIEEFYDLNLKVKGINSITQSLQILLTPEIMDGDNKIECETCEMKQEMWLGTRIKALPRTLVFTLNRFDFDYEKLDRVKINDYFQFDLEYNFNYLLEDNQESHSYDYELYGVIIHQGSAHGGHYFAYVRDVMQESDWKKTLQETLELEKSKTERESTEPLTEEQKMRREDQQKQNQIFALKEPTNKSLLQNWHILDDNVVTPMEASQISSKFQGSSSAYILFYRKKDPKSEEIQKQVSHIPEYFAQEIQARNSILKSEREVYENQKNHIILKINGVDEKLNLKMKIREFIECFVGNGESLVQESSHNGLPYYPMQFKNDESKVYPEEELLEKWEIAHESLWTKHSLTSDDYLKNIKAVVGKDRLPFELNVLLEGSTKKLVVYQDQTLLMLRLQIENQMHIPYEKQILKLVTPYKELFLTDNILNDDLLLPKLGFIQNCQLILKTLDQLQDQEPNQEVQAKKQSSLYCFIIERDDVIGIKRIYFEKSQTLQELLDSQMNSDKLTGKHRFRNLNGNRLYYVDHYTKKLQDLGLEEQMIKFRIERGEIPVKGDICVKVKIQSKFHPEVDQVEIIIEKIFDPNISVLSLKEEICAGLQLKPEEHKIYMTDWMGEPIRSITREKQTIFQTNFSREENICLRDIYSPIGSQLIHFEVFVTENGSCDNISRDGIHVKVEEFKNVEDLKNALLQTEEFGKIKGINIHKIRVRQLKRDMMFGYIWRDLTKQLKHLTINSTKIVVQILDHEEFLTDDQLVLSLKIRNSVKRIYQGNIELIFDAGKNPSLEHLKQQIQSQLQIQHQIVIAKYFNYNFQWTEISHQNIQNLMKGKKKNVPVKNQKQKKIKKNQKIEVIEKEKQIKDIEIIEKQKPNEIVLEQNGQQKTDQPSQIQKSQQPKQEKHTQQFKKEERKNEGKRKKKQKDPNGQAGESEKVQKKLLEDAFNLRKAPILLKDGDWIGFANEKQVEQLKDDLQTEEDLSMRILKNDNRTTAKYNRKEQGGFKINVGF